MDIFKIARQRVEAIKRAEAYVKPLSKREKCVAKRDAELERLNWTCPQCDRQVLDKSRWAKSMCRSCAMKAKLIEKRYSYMGEELAIARENAGLSQAMLGSKCGWSRQYQCKLERPGEHTMSEDTMRTLQRFVELTTNG